MPRGMGAGLEVRMVTSVLLNVISSLVYQLWRNEYAPNVRGSIREFST